jgi:hypothetical protein
MPPPQPPQRTTGASYFYGLYDEVFEVLLHEPGPSERDVPEALVHDLWRNQRYDRSNLLTVGGVPIHVVHPGRLNSDTGPDFLDARLRIGNTSWRGAVEIHTTSGIWIDHGHDRDPVYNSTLLHVSLYSDIWTGRLKRADGTILPEMVLYPRLETPLRRLIHTFRTQQDPKLPCASGWDRVPAEVRDPWIRRLGIERFNEKKRRSALAESLERRMFEDVFAGLGYAKNSGAMRTLARTASLDRLRPLDDVLDVEAVLFGCAGLIPHPADLLEADRDTADYAMELRDRFERINFRLNVDPMPTTAWRFFRLRPANFPPLRIAQAAALSGSDRGFLRDNPIDIISNILLRDPRPLRALRSLFEVELPEFWHFHVRLDRRSKAHTPKIGRARIDALLVNSVLPVVATFADRRGDKILAGTVLQTASRIPAGSDVVTRQFEALGTSPTNALDAQGLHQLFRTRCTQARCLTCDIGRHLLSDTSRESELPNPPTRGGSGGAEDQVDSTYLSDMPPTIS